MKKIKNMTAAEAKQAFTKWETKHPRHNDFDFNATQIGNYKELFIQADRESIIDLIYDLFNYGFMAGYRQAETELKAKVNKRVKDDMHRRLLELVYYLPFGYRAEYFYCMMSYLLPEDCFYLMPNRVTKPMLEIRAEREDRKSKEAEPEPEQTAEEKQAGEYRCNIARMVYDIENVDILMKIYTVAKTHLEILQEKEGALTNRNDIAKAIAKDLLNNDALDEHNFSYNTAAILEYVQNIILKHLKDYSLLSGTIF